MSGKTHTVKRCIVESECTTDALMSCGCSPHQDVLQSNEIDLDWMFKLSFAYDIVNVSMCNAIHFHTLYSTYLFITAHALQLDL